MWMKTIRSERKEDLGGRRTPPFGGGAFSLQTSLNLPELPPRAPAPAKRRFDSQCKGGCSRGKFLLVWELGSCYSVRLSRLIGGYGIVQPLTSYIRPKRNDTRVVPSQSSTNFLPFLSGSGREATAAKIPLDGILLGSSRNSQHGKRLHQNQYNKKQGAKIPLLKVLEILKNFFQEVFKQSSGQSPEVLGFGTESQGLPLTPHSIPWLRVLPL